MPITDSKEHMVKLAGLAGDITCIPLKKRILLLAQSASCPYPITTASDGKEQQQVQPTLEVGSQICTVGTTHFEDSYNECIEHTSCNEVPTIQNAANAAFSASHMASNIVGIQIGNSQESALDDRPSIEPDMLRLELGSATSGSIEQFVADGVCDIILKGRTTFSRSLGNSVALPLKGLNVSYTEMESSRIEQKELNFCFEDPKTPKRSYSALKDSTISESKSDSVSPCEDRSNWDLNTMMDTWGGSAGVEVASDAVCGHLETDSRSTGNNRLESGFGKMDSMESHWLHVKKEPGFRGNDGEHTRLHNLELVSDVCASSAASQKLIPSPKSQLHAPFHQRLFFPFCGPEPDQGSHKTGLNIASGKTMPVPYSRNPEVRISHGCNPQMHCQVTANKAQANKLNVVLQKVKPEPSDSCVTDDTKFVIVKPIPMGDTSLVKLKPLKEIKSHVNDGSDDKATDIIKGNLLLASLQHPTSKMYGNAATRSIASEHNQSSSIPSCESNLAPASILIAKVDACGVQLVGTEDMMMSNEDESFEVNTITKESDFKNTDGASDTIMNGLGLISEDAVCELGETLVTEDFLKSSSIVSTLDNSTASDSPAVISTCEVNSHDKGGQMTEKNNSETPVTICMRVYDANNLNDHDHTDPECGKRKKLKMNHEDDMEDGEVRDLQHDAAEERSFCATEIEQAKDKWGTVHVASETMCHSKTLLVSEKQTEALNLEGANKFPDSVTTQCGGEKCSNDDDDAQTSTVTNRDANKKGSLKITKRVPQSHSCKKKESVRKQLSDKNASKSNTILKKDDPSVTKGNKAESGCSDILPENHPTSSNLGGLPTHGSSKHITSKIFQIKLSASNNDSSSERIRSIALKPVSSHIEKDNGSDNSYREHQPHPGIRKDGQRETARFDKVGRQNIHGIKCRNDHMRCTGEIDNKIEPPCGDDMKNNVEYSSEQFSCLTNFRIPKSKNISGTFGGFSKDRSAVSPIRAVRRQVSDKSESFSRLPSRGLSPRQRGCMPVISHLASRTMRDVSPSRRIDENGGDIPLLGLERRMMRGMPGDKVDISGLAGPHPNYEQMDDAFLRQQRSISPVRRKPHPQLAHMSPPSLRPHNRSHPWSPSRRSSGIFDVPKEQIHHRSSQSLSIERLPGQYDCFLEDMPERRCGSPPFASHPHDGMRNMASTRDYDLPRPGRGLQRNMRRFPTNITLRHDEQCFGPLHSGHHGDIADDNRDEGRDFVGRRGFVRSMSQRYNANGVRASEAGSNIPFHVERGQRPVRFSADANNEFPNRDYLRDRCIRSQIGEIPQRIIDDIEVQEDMYRSDDIQEWHGSGFIDSRLKRRRF